MDGTEDINEARGWRGNRIRIHQHLEPEDRFIQVYYYLTNATPGTFYTILYSSRYINMLHGVGTRDQLNAPSY